jgi:streptomycin 6-kinase
MRFGKREVDERSPNRSVMALPARFVRTLHEVFPDRGPAWLSQLPALVAQIERRWSIQVGPPFANLSYNYVAPARRADGSEAVLKLGLPNPELLSEIEALRLYDGRGIARLLQAEPEQGALLIERLLPGTSLAALADDESATEIAAHVMRQLWRPLPHNHPFATVAHWAAGLGRLRARYNGSTGPLPAELVQRAEGLFRDLLGSSSAPVLLHGDLHHDNILAAQREPWLALDPKGVAGEPAYEVGALMRNPRPQPAPILARRASILAEVLEVDRSRILAWSFAQAVLSAWWSVEDHGHGWEGAIEIARQIATLI